MTSALSPLPMSASASMESTVVRSMATASPSRAFSFCGSSATGFVTTTRGSCSQTWPSAAPSCPVAPRKTAGKRCVEGCASLPRKAPSSAISASTIADSGLVSGGLTMTALPAASAAAVRATANISGWLKGAMRATTP